MSDVIALRGLAVEACHGVLPQEKTTRQPFLIDIDLEVDLSRAGASDDLADTVSYAEVAHRAVAVLAGDPVDLIEHLAERVAGACLATSGLVESVAVTVHKPQAPIGLPFADVAVTRRVAREARAVIALGANLDAPVARLTDAVRRLADTAGVELVAVSPIVETDPVGGPAGQSVYLNAVVIARTRLAPWSLLARLHEIEGRHGRTREVRWGPRTLDLDLISYDDARQGGEVRSDDPILTLPHPRASERCFVLVPWALADPSDDRPRAALRSLGVDTTVADSRDDADCGPGVRRGPDWPDAVRDLAPPVPGVAR